MLGEAGPPAPPCPKATPSMHTVMVPMPCPLHHGACHARRRFSRASRDLRTLSLALACAAASHSCLENWRGLGHAERGCPVKAFLACEYWCVCPRAIGWDEGKGAKQASGVCPSAHACIKRCHANIQEKPRQRGQASCLCLHVIARSPASCPPRAHPKACQHCRSSTVFAVRTGQEEGCSCHVHTEYALWAPS